MTSFAITIGNNEPIILDGMERKSDTEIVVTKDKDFWKDNICPSIEFDFIPPMLAKVVENV